MTDLHIDHQHVVPSVVWQLFPLDFRCLGEQAGLSGGVSNRPQSGLLWAHPELSETRTAHHQRRHQPFGYDRHTLSTHALVSRLLRVLILSRTPAGVLEEARFFGIEQLAEQLETLIKVSVCQDHTYGGARCAFIARLLTATCFQQSSQPPDDHSPLTRKEFIRFLLATTTKSELRCQVGNKQHT